MQAKRKETPEHLEHRLVQYIRSAGRYVSLKELRSVFHFSDKLIYARGLSCPKLNLKAGVISRLPDATKTKEELESAYVQLLIAERGIRVNEAAKKLGVSVGYLNKLGIKASELRKRLGLANVHSRTKDEIETLIVSWLRTQPCYRSAQDICTALHIDYTCAIQRNGLDVGVLNAKAGHRRISVSYFEEYAVFLCVQAGLQVERQKTFDGCIDKKKLRYDIWLPEYNALIEVNGAQHYSPKYPGYEEQLKRDAIKARFAKDHNISLYVVDILPKDTFESRLQELIHKLKGGHQVTDDMHTVSNCWDTLAGNAEGNQQPSLDKLEEGSTTILEGSTPK